MADTDRLTIPRPLRVYVQESPNQLIVERSLPEQAAKDRGDPRLDVKAAEVFPLIRALQRAAGRLHIYDAESSNAAELKIL